MSYKIINKNALDALKEMPDESIDCVITSPPYYGLRSYKGADTTWGGNPECDHEWVGYIRKGMSGGLKSPMLKRKSEENFQIVSNQEQTICSKCGAWNGQLGLEPTFQMYIDHLMMITREIKRVLKKTGTLFWNMGDSYIGGHKGGSIYNKEWKISKTDAIPQIEMGRPQSNTKNMGISEKSLMMIPERFAMAMIDDGWILRNKIIWHKPNGMPSSVKDRFSNKWEYVFFFVKSKKYYFDLDAVKKPLTTSSIKRISQKNIPNQLNTIKIDEFGKEYPNMSIKKILNNMHQKYDEYSSYEGKHIGYLNEDDSIWVSPLESNQGDVLETHYHPKGDPTIHGQRLPPQPGQEGAFNPNGANPGDVINTPAVRHKSWYSGKALIHERLYDPDADGGDFLSIATIPHKESHFAVYPETLVTPLIKAGCPKHGVVLDPFAGSGTTGVVAEILGRDSILIEISSEYVKIIEDRMKTENIDKVCQMLIKKKVIEK
ncbi:MAG: DNA-methyltransferase [Thermoplasmata archaeon]